MYFLILAAKGTKETLGTLRTDFLSLQIFFLDSKHHLLSENAIANLG